MDRQGWGQRATLMVYYCVSVYDCILISFLTEAVDIHWLGVHYSDLFEEDGTPLVSLSSLQPWVTSDKRVSEGLKVALQKSVSII